MPVIAIPHRYVATIAHFLVRPEAIACGADLNFSAFFLPTRNLRDAWADRREILHDGQ